MRKIKASDNLDDLFDEFYAIKNAEGMADSTLRQYEENYAFFVSYLDNHDIGRNMKEIDRKTIRKYIVYMRDEHVRFDSHRFKTVVSQTVGLAPSTINTRLKTLRVMFNCLIEEEIIDTSPIAGVKNIAEPLEEFDILTIEELRSLIKAPDRKSFTGFRDYVIIHVLIDCMLRIGELSRLKVDDFDFENKTVTVRAKIAKNRKTRTLPLKPLTLRLVRELIRINEDFQTEYVFLSNYGDPITRDHFRKRLNEHAEVAKIKKNVHPHLLRHTSATLFLEDGGDMSHLRLLLGHADLRMVMRYTHLSNKSLQRQHAKHSPINKVASKMSRPRKTKI